MYVGVLDTFEHFWNARLTQEFDFGGVLGDSLVQNRISWGITQDPWVFGIERAVNKILDMWFG